MQTNTFKIRPEPLFVKFPESAGAEKDRIFRQKSTPRLATAGFVGYLIEGRQGSVTLPLFLRYFYNCFPGKNL